MKILHTADLHIGMTNYSKLDPETGLESRLLDFLKSLDFIVDTAIKEGVDAFIFAGDAYKTRDPSPTQQRGFGERLKKLTKAGIPVILVVGNHDTPNAEGKANTLDIYSALEIDNVYVLRKPQLINIPTKSGNLQIISAPWMRRDDFKKMGEKLPLLYDKINPSASSGPAVLAGHLEVEGSSFGSEKGLVIDGGNVTPLSLLQDKRLSYVALGHIHKFQELSKNPPIVYSGSPERIDFGEEKEEKGFVLIDIPALTTHNRQPATYKFIPSGARKFVSITVNLKASDNNPTQTILDEIKKHEVADAIVKVIINIPAGLDREIEMDKIKKTLVGAHIIAGISRNVERENRQKLEGTEDVERLTPIEAMEKYFELKKFPPEKIKNLKKYASALLEN